VHFDRPAIPPSAGPSGVRCIFEIASYLLRWKLLYRFLLSDSSLGFLALDIDRLSLIYSQDAFLLRYRALFIKSRGLFSLSWNQA